MKNPIFSLLREFRWHLLAILILLTVRAQVPAEEGAIHIPTAVYALIDQADADVAKVHAALAVKLKKEQDMATKKGDLELAMWLKNKIEALGGSASTGEHSTRDVVFYTAPNYKGQSAVIRMPMDKVININLANFPDDSLRSIKVPAGVSVTAYADMDGKGQSTEITQDIPEIHDLPALGMTSFKITKTTAGSSR